MTRPANDKHFADHHEYSRDKGYEKKEYEHQEYPKEVSNYAGDRVIVNNQQEEADAAVEPKEEEAE